MSLKDNLRQLYSSLKNIEDENQSKKEVAGALSKIYASIKKTLKVLKGDNPQTK